METEGNGCPGFFILALWPTHPLPIRQSFWSTPQSTQKIQTKRASLDKARVDARVKLALADGSVAN